MRRLPGSIALAVLASLAWLPAGAQAPAGRLADATGAVAARPAGGGWSPLAPGALVAEGQTLRTGPRARAELDLGLNRLGLDPDTVLRIDSAHPATPAFTLEQGRATLLLRSLRPGQVARLHLPRGSVTLAEPGLYVVAAADGGRPASVGVSRGLAQVFGPGVSLAVPAGQTGTFGGAETAGLRQGVAEGFLADDPTPPPPQVVHPNLPPAASATQGATVPDLADLPGADPLRTEGQWAEVPEHGTVWYPPVAPAWNPYADPWAGERWGHVPWNHGAWIMIGPRWAWMPPRRIPPPAWRHAHPPPGLAQPHRPPPTWARPLPPPHVRPARPPGPPTSPPAAAPRPPGPAMPAILAPRPPPPGPAPAIVPPVIAPGAPVAAPPRMPATAPHRAPQPSPPTLVAPRPAPPPAISPPVAAPRPVAPPPRAAAPPARLCPPGRPGC